MMKTIEQQNVETVAAFIEAFWNQNDMDSTERFLSSDYVEHNYQSKEGLEQFARNILASFPDKAYTIEEIVGEGERVLVRMTMRGTHQGVFYGNAPTGRKTEVTLYREYHVVGGKITEHRGWIDIVTLLLQVKGQLTA